jgi:hypothetical protein
MNAMLRLVFLSIYPDIYFSRSSPNMTLILLTIATLCAVFTQPTVQAPAAADAPAQSGALTSCPVWYVARPGDGCDIIANAFNITTMNFQR